MGMLGFLTSLHVACNLLIGKPWGLPGGSGSGGQSRPAAPPWSIVRARDKVKI
jgi:hypothetical protein